LYDAYHGGSSERETLKPSIHRCDIIGHDLARKQKLD
jgi:hypothetical protein